MSDGERAIKEVVDATTPIAEAAAREVWPYRKVLLAVLPPTLALLSVVVGVWDNGRRDRAAAELAEQQRQDTIDENEQNRMAEATKERRAAEEREEARADEAARDLSLRRSELVLPKYEQLLIDIHGVTGPINRCIAVLNGYLTDIAPDGHLAILGDPPNQADLDLDIIPVEYLTLERLGVDSEVVESCRQISEGLDDLSLSVDQARLVSLDQLEQSARALASGLESGSSGADALLNYVEQDEVTGEWYIMVDLAYTATRDGTPLARVAAELNSSIFEIRNLLDELIRAARGRILELDQ